MLPGCCRATPARSKAVGQRLAEVFTSELWRKASGRCCVRRRKLLPWGLTEDFVDASATLTITARNSGPKLKLWEIRLLLYPPKGDELDVVILTEVEPIVSLPPAYGV